MKTELNYTIKFELNQNEACYLRWALEVFLKSGEPYGDGVYKLAKKICEDIPMYQSIKSVEEETK